jgi:hypothetical protein
MFCGVYRNTAYLTLRGLKEMRQNGEREREDIVGRDDSERRYTLREKTELFINSLIIWGYNDV